MFFQILAKNDDFSKNLPKIDDFSNFWKKYIFFFQIYVKVDDFSNFCKYLFTGQNSSKNDDFSNFEHNWSLFKVQRKNARIKIEKKLGYNIYQCQIVSSGVVSNGVEWCGVKWCRVSVMTLESLMALSLDWLTIIYSRYICALSKQE